MLQAVSPIGVATTKVMPSEVSRPTAPRSGDIGAESHLGVSDAYDGNA